MAEGERFSDLHRRVITAVLLVVILFSLEILVSVFGAFRNVFSGIALLLTAGCAYEYVSLCRSCTLQQKVLAAVALLVPGIFVWISSWSYPLAIPETTAPMVLSASFLGFGTALSVLIWYGRQSLDAVRTLAMELLMGVLLVGAGGAALVNLSSLQSHSYLYWVILVVCCNDISAYFVGVSYGVTKLSPALSPGKSVEGTLGGFLCAIVAGIVFSFLKGYTSFADTVGASLMVAVFAQLFDFSKSFIKRIVQVKDSGSLLPGHGGLLDRLDGILGGSLAYHLWNILF